MSGDQTQRLQVAPAKLADRREGLGSSSEVQGFRVEFGQWLLVERLPSGQVSECHVAGLTAGVQHG
jgi:hypothetical protein